MEKENMSTMTSILEVLAANGYSSQFKASGKVIISVATGNEYLPQDVRINHYYRFEGESNPDDSAIVYALETKAGERGTLIDSYGAYMDPEVSQFILKVEKIHK